jgi:opacity protein-like surface antigen
MYALLVFVMGLFFVVSPVAAQEAPENPPIPPVASEDNIRPDPLLFRYEPSVYIDLTGSGGFAENADLTGSQHSSGVSFEPGWGFAMALGYEPPVMRGPVSQTRFEIEAAYRVNNVKNDGIADTEDNGNLSAWTLMANAFFDLENATNVTPYVGGGLGVAAVRLKTPAFGGADGSHLSDTDVIPAYQLMTGLSLEPEIMPRVGFHVGYRFIDSFSDPKFQHDGTPNDPKHDGKFQSHNVEGGVRFKL